ncbi:MAG: Na+/H+ antiporter subunit E [Spirochaetales bacterium]|nr:Na+/H+ antiporter subunit E [Spirochaetales bacterium]
MKTFTYRLKAFLVLAGVWLILIYPFSLQELYTGLAIALLLVLLPLPGNRVYAEIGLAPKRLIFTVVYIFVLIKEIFRANIDVAFRVIKPVLPIKPGIVKVKTRLKSRLGRLALANSITLTPGTITVEIKGDELFIHWIFVDAGDADTATQKIVSQFEKYLEVIFG